jgi:2,5-diamino-6-(ribosylamino)-4(3H)-pyrimidinone 5'-phosphate reductase
MRPYVICQMLQGGGTYNGAMLNTGLVDEISQVIVPLVDGGRDVTSIFEIPGSKTPRAAARLKVTHHRAFSGGVHWLRYKVQPRRLARQLQG